MNNTLKPAFSALLIVLLMASLGIYPTFAQEETLPDVTVESIAVTPTSPEVGESATIVVTGRNSGTIALTTIAGLDSIAHVFEAFTPTSAIEPTVVAVPTTTDPLIADETFTYTWEGMFTSVGDKSLSFTLDAANNLEESNEANNMATSTVTVIDETAPVVTTPWVTNISTNSALINWNTNEASDSEVSFGLTDAYGMSASHDTFVTGHAVMLSALSTSTTYHYMVRSEDRSGNIATSTDHTFTTLAQAIDDEEEGDDDAEKVLICHYNKGVKKYNLITVARDAWEQGHSKHEGDFIPEDDSCDTTPGDVANREKKNDTAAAKLRERLRALEYAVSDFERGVVRRELQLLKRINKALTQRLHGHLLLQVENNGEAWYVDEDSDQRYYLRDGRAAFQALRAFGLGITNADLEKIPVGLNDRFVVTDTDGDGLPDKLEIALGSDPENPDSDGDGIDDKTEVLNNYHPGAQRRLQISTALANRLSGKILLQVEKHGEAWWVNPEDGKRYYLKDGDSAYNIMRFLSLGISNNDLDQIDVGTFDVE